jgi:uncharacterized protein
MARLLILGILIVTFILLVRAIFPSASKKEAQADSTEMVKDPNCETYVPRADAVRRNIKGKDHYFCGEKCAEDFKNKMA